MKVPREFKEDFDLVHRAFLTSAEEIEEAKELVRADLPAAIEGYANAARLIRRGWKPCGV